MSIKEILKTFLRAYPMIVTGSLLCTGAFCSIFWRNAELHVDLIWQILASSAAVASLFFVYYSKKELSRRAMQARHILHFVLLLALLFLCAYCFGWIASGSIGQPLLFGGLVTLVYVLIRYWLIKKQQREADEIGAALKSWHQDDL